MYVDCKHCNYKWNYNGKSDYYTSCPKCSYRVNVRKQKLTFSKGLKNFSGL